MHAPLYHSSLALTVARLLLRGCGCEAAVARLWSHHKTQPQDYGSDLTTIYLTSKNLARLRHRGSVVLDYT
jgi:hypothetical protein